MNTPEPDPNAGYDSVEMSRLILSTAAANDARNLAYSAGVPGWALADAEVMISSRHTFHLWELAEHAARDPFIGLRTSSRHKLGDLNLYDYLFTTAATLQEGLRANGSLSRLVTTNGQLRVEADTGSEVTYSYQNTVHGGRGEEICLQFVIAGYCARIRAATAGAVRPLRVAFSQPAPRSHRVFTETLGVSRVDFDSPVSTFTISAADRDYPMPNADPVLAGILNHFAALLPTPPPASWIEFVQRMLAEAIRDGSPSVDALAGRMAVSRRTLQRQLAEHGTTWRAELDIARRRQYEKARPTGTPSPIQMARLFGYADPRSTYRALQRWSQADGDQETGRLR